MKRGVILLNNSPLLQTHFMHFELFSLLGISFF